SIIDLRLNFLGRIYPDLPGNSATLRPQPDPVAADVSRLKLLPPFMPIRVFISLDRISRQSACPLDRS
ncbi:MAG TPA: hypothetical protein VG347_02135, partial [Verrucomicrobiae bacterium]|nr:hypothetical protein [Verrucomicrobiae bacterium]